MTHNLNVEQLTIVAQNIFHHLQSASKSPESSPIAPLTSSQQRRMHQKNPKTQEVEGEYV
ncbi:MULTISPECIES: hypothetical protein [unclassified Microcoleus]|uniref:hypothetical protein n=1 Tax=unclassified Microcoleus TaxID=2642155 RepID=UPI002FD0081C